MCSIKSATEGLKHKLVCFYYSINPNNSNPILLAQYCDHLASLILVELIKQLLIFSIRLKLANPSALYQL